MEMTCSGHIQHDLRSMISTRFTLWVFISLFFSGAVFANSEQSVATSALILTPKQISEWKSKSFNGLTQYQLVEHEGQLALYAKSNSAASGLFYEADIDLNQTPYLSWRWKVTQLPNLTNEQTRAGDDFGARVYIIFNDGWTFLSTKVISYVWSGQTPVGQHWPNPFVGKSAMMVSMREGALEQGWHEEKRNLKADIQQFFGKEIDRIKAIAIMTDADNSNSSAEAFYGTIKFSSD
ncbi:DUF3047 domain-containing protein [Oceanospirillum multiglobuliferum]|uniref:DUF3047 domain-containing protein n=1 Tax=Oceanospirillum multiglobuliferum TaxID=64969 RepID=UPI00099A8BC1|nr:DUF3047 domain-containing protein [Oceanospirillum multiglobuliferum]